jgi:hypothetical protein
METSLRDRLDLMAVQALLESVNPALLPRIG